MSLRKLTLALCVIAGTAAAGPFQYSFSAPAITTGAVQGDAYSFTFTSPDILTSDTNLITLGTFSAPNSFDPAFPDLNGAILFMESVGSFAITYEGTGPAEIGSILGSELFDHVGTYSVNWQIVGSQVAGDSVEGTLTISDEAGSTAPEPSALTLMAAGVVLVGLRFTRRKSIARCNPR